MKYIRTKDGVYEIIREILDGEAYEVKVSKSKWEYDEDNKCYYEDSKLDAFYKKDILKQSDNLDDLCDEFVDEEQHYIIQNKKLIKDIPNKSELKNHTIYGAIWVKGKGLIYVAKMNEKGELELI